MYFTWSWRSCYEKFERESLHSLLSLNPNCALRTTVNSYIFGVINTPTLIVEWKLAKLKALAPRLFQCCVLSSDKKSLTKNLLHFIFFGSLEVVVKHFIELIFLWWRREIFVLLLTLVSLKLFFREELASKEVFSWTWTENNPLRCQKSSQKNLALWFF